MAVVASISLIPKRSETGRKKTERGKISWRADSYRLVQQVKQFDNDDDCLSLTKPQNFRNRMQKTKNNKKAEFVDLPGVRPLYYLSAARPVRAPFRD